MSSVLTSYRKLKNQSLEVLSDALGVDKSTLWRWETGKVPVDRLVDVERVTGLSRQDLRPDIFGEAA